MEPQRLGEGTCVRGNHLVCGGSSKNPGPSAEGAQPPTSPAGRLSAKPTRSPATCPAPGGPQAAGTLSHPTLGSVSLPGRLTGNPALWHFPAPCTLHFHPPYLQRVIQNVWSRLLVCTS